MFRAVARSENLGGARNTRWGECAPLVEIGLTDLPKSGGGARAPPAPPLATGLMFIRELRVARIFLTLGFCYKG